MIISVARDKAGYGALAEMRRADAAMLNRGITTTVDSLIAASLPHTYSSRVAQLPQPAFFKKSRLHLFAAKPLVCRLPVRVGDG
jgi:hypothetical protein